jgi:Tfp pilus assembly protein PilX
MSVLQRSSIRTRLSDESGVALFVALAVMLVITVLVVSVISYTSSNSRAASRSTAGQKAYAAAEAGLNNAIVAVQNAGTDTSKMPAYPAVGGLPAPQVTSLSGNATVTWGGSYNAATKIWTVKATGSVPNPTGPLASPVTRTITQTVTATPPPYTFVSLENSCENHTLLIQSSGQLNVTNAMYINSCSNSDGFDIFGTGGNISDPAGIKTVGGWETHNGDTVTANGTLCPLSTASPPDATTGCPVTGQPVLADPFAGKLTAPTLGGPACTSGPSYGTNATSYSPTKQYLVGNITATQTTITSTGTAVQTGDLILIDNEDMLVTAGGGTTTLTVQRAYNGTAAATHNNNKEIKYFPFLGTLGTAALPSPCLYTSGSVTLNPGTYYGGICIGSASTANCQSSNCSTSGTSAAYNPSVSLNAAIAAIDTSVPVKWGGGGTDPVSAGDVILVENEEMLVTAAPATTSPATLTVTRAYAGTTAASHGGGKAVSKVTTSNVSVTLNPGTYIMAGGGFRVCGASNLSAPNVMIYNTQDPSNTSGYGALDQFELNTTGNVNIGPQTSGAYQGLTIFQDKNLALSSSTGCNQKNSNSNQSSIDMWDVALVSAASTGANGSLGSISGSIYAPADHSDFADMLSGTANLAVLTSCILINGATSTFAFNPTGLFASQWVLGPQAG